jgi:hypothetical protein
MMAARKSYLLDLLGIRTVSSDSEGGNYPSVSGLHIGEGITASYSPLTQVLTLTATPTLSEGYVFTNTTEGGGIPTLTPAPEEAQEIAALTNATSENKDYDPGADGVYRWLVSVTLKRSVGGEYRTQDYAVVGIRESGTMTLLGTPQELTIGGDTTGVTVTITANGGGIRANVDNETGETVDGYIWFSPLRGALVVES